MLLGNLLAALSFLPIYAGMKAFASPLNVPGLTLLAFVQVFLSAMVYGPLGAFLAELFPAKIRYTSLSISYGIGTGDVGDSTLLIVPALTIATGNIFVGLLWSTAIPFATFALGSFFLKKEKIRQQAERS